MNLVSKLLEQLKRHGIEDKADWEPLLEELNYIDKCRLNPIGEVVAWGDNIPTRPGINRSVDFRWLNISVAPGTQLYAVPPVRPVKMDLVPDNYQGDVGPGKTVMVEYEVEVKPGLQIGPGLTTGSFLKADAPCYGLFLDEVGNRAAMAFMTESGKAWSFREITYADSMLIAVNTVFEWLSELPIGHVMISNSGSNPVFARMLMEKGVSVKMVNMGKSPDDESEAARYFNNRSKLYSAISPFPVLTNHRLNHIPRALCPDELYSIGERGKWRIKNLQTMKEEYPCLYMTLEAMALAMGNPIGKQLSLDGTIKDEPAAPEPEPKPEETKAVAGLYIDFDKYAVARKTPQPTPDHPEKMDWKIVSCEFKEDSTLAEKIEKIKGTLSLLGNPEIFINYSTINCGICRELIQAGYKAEITICGAKPYREDDKARYTNRRAVCFDAMWSDSPSALPFFFPTGGNKLAGLVYSITRNVGTEQGTYLRAMSIKSLADIYPYQWHILEALALAYSPVIYRKD